MDDGPRVSLRMLQCLLASCNPPRGFWLLVYQWDRRRDAVLQYHRQFARRSHDGETVKKKRVILEAKQDVHTHKGKIEHGYCLKNLFLSDI